MRGSIGLFAAYQGYQAIGKSTFFAVALYLLGSVWILTALIGHWPFDKEEEDEDIDLY